ncbi:MAG: hypothetical protein ACYC33_04915 [Thermoleophilia bacterium]
MALRRKAATLTLVIGMAAASAGSPEATRGADAVGAVGASDGPLASLPVENKTTIIQFETRRTRQVPGDDTPLPPAA